jgi:hypothetical protein
VNAKIRLALAQMRQTGAGPWAPQILAEDLERLDEYERTREGVPFAEVKAWMESWSTAGELPVPKVCKL